MKMDRDEIAARLKLAADDLQIAYELLFADADTLLSAEIAHTDAKAALDDAETTALLAHFDNPKELGSNDELRKASIASLCAKQRDILAIAAQRTLKARSEHAKSENAVRLSRELAAIARSLASLVSGVSRGGDAS